LRDFRVLGLRVLGLRVEGSLHSMLFEGAERRMWRGRGKRGRTEDWPEGQTEARFRHAPRGNEADSHTHRDRSSSSR